ncbi:uncharacterized protein TRIADDRAFT_58032 [Trichoplax adhaerens]|uniref:Mif2/CENP-C cupin domain-containing protein n=1 Tax=Trichoplax adhaerens TaxID=10228 RepID=B3S2I0_TRIAD|nr:hypothetical protein TRIADDRAFT_58032 [Trichoplax adhaerens]EDV23423.1 hypothetical protein TRIADDRAFT_58032 [Trichoplax adhaerens]|eukprot:XP_002114333.1 hypothetical protein TRIADDRAFT_58032 [Trichoplax adhaerens]
MPKKKRSQSSRPSRFDHVGPLSLGLPEKLRKLLNANSQPKRLKKAVRRDDAGFEFFEDYLDSIQESSIDDSVLSNATPKSSKLKSQILPDLTTTPKHQSDPGLRDSHIDFIEDNITVTPTRDNEKNSRAQSTPKTTNIMKRIEDNDKFTSLRTYNDISFSSCDEDGQNNTLSNEAPSPIVEIEEDRPCNESMTEEVDVIDEIPVNSNESIEIEHISDNITHDEVVNVDIAENNISVHPAATAEITVDNNIDDEKENNMECSVEVSPDVEDSTRKAKRHKFAIPLSNSSVFTNESVVISSELDKKNINRSSHISTGPKKSFDLAKKVFIKPQKIIEPKNERTPGVRRSNRKRVRTLEYWRGERIQYKANTSGLQIGGVISPHVSKKIRHNGVGIRKMGEGGVLSDEYDCDIKTESSEDEIESLDDYETTATPSGVVFNSSQSKEVLTTVVATESMLTLKNPAGEVATENDPLKMAKVWTNDRGAIGLLEIAPEKEKGTQFVRKDRMYFVILKGKLAVDIGRKKTILNERSFFFVPEGNTYNIKNISKKKPATVAFMQLKGMETPAV